MANRSNFHEYNLAVSRQLTEKQHTVLLLLRGHYVLGISIAITHIGIALAMPSCMQAAGGDGGHGSQPPSWGPEM